jgi:hypothetical protein
MLLSSGVDRRPLECFLFAQLHRHGFDLDQVTDTRLHTLSKRDETRAAPFVAGRRPLEAAMKVGDALREPLHMMAPMTTCQRGPA